MTRLFIVRFWLLRVRRAPKGPLRWDKPGEAPQKLLSREFILLFLMAMCSNSYIAVYYCFEQWLQQLGIAPDWRGVLLSALFAMVLLFRPLTSVVMLRHGKFWAMLVSLLVSSCVLLAYPYVQPANAVPVIFFLRVIQGVALAVYSSCTIAVLVNCIPPGQSARGFALFSLTMLLPYSIIPAISETILPLLGGEARLFAVTAVLGLPSLVMLFLLAPALRRPEMPARGQDSMSRSELWRAISHSGLLFVNLACLSFSMTTVLAIFFMKGLCGVTGAHPTWFFSTYTITIILVRLFGSNRMDTLPRYRVTTLCACVIALCMLGFAFGPLWSFIPIACVYGVGLGLLYPLLAAAVYDRSEPQTRSVNSNVMMAMFDASGMLAPLLGGQVINAGYGYRGLFVTAAVTVTCCGLFMVTDRFRLARRNARGRDGNFRRRQADS